MVLVALAGTGCNADTEAGADDDIGESDGFDEFGESGDSCIGMEWIADEPHMAGSTQVSVSSQLAALRGLELGDQVRIERAGAEQYALFTVSEIRALDSLQPTMMVGMNAEARMRLGMNVDDPEVCAHVVTKIAPMAPEFVEDGVQGDTRIFVMAPHGGAIEFDTDEQAGVATSVLADYAPTTWSCRGVHEGGGSFRIWHVPSTEISVNSFPRLAQLAAHDYEWALAFHGFSPDGDCVESLGEVVDDPESLVIVGGAAARPLRQDVADAIQAVLGETFQVVVAAGGACAGEELDNLLNRMASSLQTVQIESGVAAREGDNDVKVAKAVAEVLINYLGEP